MKKKRMVEIFHKTHGGESKKKKHMVEIPIKTWWRFPLKHGGDSH